jgi:hypothetical protein
MMLITAGAVRAVTIAGLGDKRDDIDKGSGTPEA